MPEKVISPRKKHTTLIFLKRHDINKPSKHLDWCCSQPWSEKLLSAENSDCYRVSELVKGLSINDFKYSA